MLYLWLLFATQGAKVLANFLAISRELKKDKLIVQKILKLTAYFIHCDLIDRDQNFLNNKRSDLLAKIDVKGKPYEKVRYDAFPQQPFRTYSTSSHVNSVTGRFHRSCAQPCQNLQRR